MKWLRLYETPFRRLLHNKHILEIYWKGRRINAVSMYFDLAQIIQNSRFFGIFDLVFAKSGFFFCFFLPSESLLFTAGFLTSQNLFNLSIVILLLILATIVGESVGHWTGRKLGGWLLRQKDSLFFKKHLLFKAQQFYEKHGVKTLILARFVPAIRTFAPIVTGIANIQYISFLSDNISFIQTLRL